MKNILYIAVVLFCVEGFYSCRKDKLITDSSAKLSFTRDSVLFDTVFTKISSVTKLFRVHNNSKGPLNISSIRLARGASSFYRLNVDGIAGTPGHVFENIEIASKDSIYIFVEVTINPNADPSVSPFIYRDSILFETNGNKQDVDLISFGQNAYYHMPNKKIIISNTQAIYYEVEPCNTTWKNDKPHLVYGYAVVDSACNLIIQDGTKIYFHNNGGIWVYRYGSIQVKGIYGNPVTFQGDRLEQEYKNVPGQWDRIWINEGSTANVINYAIIKNAFIGVHAGYSVLDGYGGSTINSSDQKHLYISNTIIQNCSFAGILAHYYNITGGNDVISNCGKYLGVFQYGGNYSFKHCTFANYWSQTNNGGGSQTRATPSFFFNNYVGSTPLLLDSAFFGNCILAGNINEEFQFDTTATPGYLKKLIFDYCLLTTQQNTSNAKMFKNCLINNPLSNNSPSFVNSGTYNFHLNSNSSAISWGTPLYSAQWLNDIENKPRSSPPDLGAYKY